MAGRGGHAVGGIYNSGTLTLLGTDFSGNLGAGGGGGSGITLWPEFVSGNGGTGVGSLWNAGGSVRIGVNGRTLEVRVPKGIKPGQSIRLARQGNSGGDLLLEIEYAAHPQFEVDGRNVIHVLPVAPWEAALGATLSVPTLGGSVELKIPADSEAGRKLRLRGRGLPGGAQGTDGDQIVELEILAPRAHDDAQRAAYATMRDAFGDDWRRA